ncbi:MAG: LytR/AlgR family response regulator transcription factor [Gemmatimonadales bacterium]
MTRLRAVIVDDEPLARATIRQTLTPEDQVDVVAEFGDGTQAVAGLRRVRPDLVFLDIQMPGLDGFEVLRQLPADDLPAVVFVTAYDHYAVRAFEVHAVDYLLKPVDGDRLKEAIERVRAGIEGEQASEARSRLAALLGATPGAPPSSGPGGSGSPSRVLVKEDGDILRFVKLSQVLWIGTAGNNVVFHTASGTHQLRMTLRALLPHLDPALFRRIHRSTVVNLNAIREIQPWFAGDCVVILTDGQKLRLSRTYRDQLIQPLL